METSDVKAPMTEEVAGGPGEDEAMSEGTAPDESPEEPGSPEGKISRATLEAMKGTADEDEPEPVPRYQAYREQLRERYMKYRESGIVFKALMALATGIVAASVIVMAGMFSERDTDIVFSRAQVGFFVSGALMFLLSIWMERFGIPMYVSRHEELKPVWMREAEEPDEPGAANGTEELSADSSPVSDEPVPVEEAEAAPEPVDEEPEGGGGPESPPEDEAAHHETGDEENTEKDTGFSPMTEDMLERVKTPDEPER